MTAKAVLVIDTSTPVSLDGDEVYLDKAAWRLDSAESFSDWTIETSCGEEGTGTKITNTYNVHRLILATGQHSSKYFERQFKMNTVETMNKCTEVHLEEETFEVFPMMLDFVYGIDLNFQNLQAAHRLVALKSLASYFQIDTLMQDVCQEIVKHLHSSNIFEYIGQAKKHQDDHLLAEATAKVVGMFDKTSPDFVSNPTFASDALHSSIEIFEQWIFQARGWYFKLALIFLYSMENMGEISVSRFRTWMSHFDDQAWNDAVADDKRSSNLINAICDLPARFSDCIILDCPVNKAMKLDLIQKYVGGRPKDMTQEHVAAWMTNFEQSMPHEFAIELLMMYTDTDIGPHQVQDVCMANTSLWRTFAHSCLGDGLDVNGSKSRGTKHNNRNSQGDTDPASLGVTLVERLERLRLENENGDAQGDSDPTYIGVSLDVNGDKHGQFKHQNGVAQEKLQEEAESNGKSAKENWYESLPAVKKVELLEACLRQATKTPSVYDSGGEECLVIQGSYQ